MKEIKENNQWPSRLLAWAPDIFLFIVVLAELAALLTLALGWSERVVWGAIIAVLWAGIQAIMLSFAAAGLTKGEPLSVAQLMTALLRSILSTVLFFAVTFLAVNHSGVLGKMAFGTSAAAMLLNAAYIMLLKKRIR